MDGNEGAEQPPEQRAPLDNHLHAEPHPGPQGNPPAVHDDLELRRVHRRAVYRFVDGNGHLRIAGKQDRLADLAYAPAEAPKARGRERIVRQPDLLPGCQGAAGASRDVHVCMQRGADRNE